jgi:hypothetical protein
VDNGEMDIEEGIRIINVFKGVLLEVSGYDLNVCFHYNFNLTVYFRNLLGKLNKNNNILKLSIWRTKFFETCLTLKSNTKDDFGNSYSILILDY